MFLGLAFRDRVGIGEEGLTRMDDLRDLVVLGLESSCDETAAAVVRRRADGSVSFWRMNGAASLGKGIIY